MEQGASVQVTAHDLAGGVDPKRVRSVGARKIDSGERAFVQKEAVVSGRFEATHDPPSGVDVDGLSISGARGVDRGESTLVQDKGIYHAAAIRIAANDLAASIDTEHLRGRRTRNVNRAEDALV